MCVMEVQYPVGNGTTTIDLKVKVFLRYGLLRGCADRMETECLTIWYIMGGNVWFFFSFIVISWRLITLQYYSGFCHTLTWISHGFTCVPIPIPPPKGMVLYLPLKSQFHKHYLERSGLSSISQGKGKKRDFEILVNNKLKMSNRQGTSLLVQWLSLCTPDAGGTALIPGQG